MRERYEPDTQERQGHAVRRFLCFEETLKAINPNYTEADIVSAFMIHTRSHCARPNKWNSVSNLLWLLQSGLQMNRDRKLAPYLMETLHRAIRKKWTPTQKANPLSFAQLSALLKSRTLSRAAKAYAVWQWLCTQRPSNSLDVDTSNVVPGVVDGAVVVTVFWLTKRKGKTAVEQLLPKCQRLAVGSLGYLTEYIQERQGMEKLWDPETRDELEEFLKKIPVTYHHPLLRPHYTLYSLKRGALQQLAWLEPDQGKILALSLHARLEGLAVYIGSFLHPTTGESLRLSNLLSQAPPIPVPQEMLPAPKRIEASKVTSPPVPPPDPCPPEPQLGRGKRTIVAATITNVKNF